MSKYAFHRSQAEMLQERPPPLTSTGIIGWMRANLFSSWLSAALTVASIAVLALVVPGLIEWAFIDATLTGELGRDCPSEGACWAWLDQRINQFFYGFYPAEAYWRVHVCLVLLVPALAYLLFAKLPYARYGRWFSLAYPVIAAFLLVGGLGLDVVRTDQFGGFMLNLIAGITGIVLSLPIGILLALGRRSRMPIVRVFSVGFIEFIRGVPLITLLFVAIILLPLFLPPEVSLDQLVV